jgi:hypothetical protein
MPHRNTAAFIEDTRRPAARGSKKATAASAPFEPFLRTSDKTGVNLPSALLLLAIWAIALLLGFVAITL